MRDLLWMAWGCRRDAGVVVLCLFLAAMMEDPKLPLLAAVPACAGGLRRIFF